MSKPEAVRPSYNGISFNKVSFSTNLIMGLQHVLAMCPVSISVPLILGSQMNLDSKTIAYLVSANMLTSAFAVLIQLFGIGKSIGSRLPIVLGSAFAPLSGMIMVGKEYDLPTVFGAVIASGLIMCLITYGLKYILKFFPPLVVGAFITLIGITLSPNAFSDIAGGAGSSDFGSAKNILLGVSVVLIIVFLSHFGNGFIRSISLLLGLVIGTLISIPLGLLDLTPVSQADWVQVVLPFHFGAPKFVLNAILILTLFSLIGMIQCVGIFGVWDNMTGSKTPQEQMIKGMRGQTVAQVLSGLFNSVPGTMYIENISLMQISGVGASSTIAYGGVLLALFSLTPKFSTLITCIPKPVIGGVTLAMFATITAAGISILASGVDFSDSKNTLVLGIGLSLGIGAYFTQGAFEQMPALMRMLLSNALFVVGAATILLNQVLNIKKSKVEDHPSEQLQP